MSFHQMRPGSSSSSTCLVWLGTSDSAITRVSYSECCQTASMSLTSTQSVVSTPHVSSNLNTTNSHL